MICISFEEIPGLDTVIPVVLSYVKASLVLLWCVIPIIYLEWWLAGWAVARTGLQSGSPEGHPGAFLSAGTLACHTVMSEIGSD